MAKYKVLRGSHAAGHGSDLRTYKRGEIIETPKNLEKLFNYQGSFKQKLSFRLIPLAMKKHASLKPSMLQDIEKGKKCEVESINGILSKEGKRAGIATPVNDLVVQLIGRIETKQAYPGWSNLEAFKSFLS